MGMIPYMGIISHMPQEESHCQELQISANKRLKNFKPG